MTTESLPDPKFCGFCGKRLDKVHNSELCLKRARARAAQSAADKARPKCCCQMGYAVKGEFPEFDCTDCPVHKAGLGAHEHRCGKHERERAKVVAELCCCNGATFGTPGCSDCPIHGKTLTTHGACYDHIF